MRVARFNPRWQVAFRELVLGGLEEHWGTVDHSLNPDLDDIAACYRDDIVLMAIDRDVLVGTAILLLRPPQGEIVRMSVHRDHRRQGVGRRLVDELSHVARRQGLERLEAETNAKWADARAFYEGLGFSFLRHAPGTFGREAFYGLELRSPAG